MKLLDFFLKTPPFCDLVKRKTSFGNAIHNLDSMRGLAVLFVTASHTQAFFQHKQGAIGVWIFFSLSGFLLSQPFIKNPETTINIKYILNYFIRRIKRILPLFYLTLTFMFMFSERTFKWFYEHIIFIKAEFHFWSIRQELLFYLLLPIIILLLKYNKLKSWIFALILIVTAYIGEEYLIHVWNISKFPGTNEPLYLSPFIFGIAFSILYLKTNIRFNKYIWIIILSFLLFSNYQFVDFVCILIKIKPFDGSLAWAYPNIYGLLCSILVFCSLTKSKITDFILGSYLLRLIGIVGFSFYIFHWFFMSIGVRIGFTFGTGLFLFVTITTLIFSCITYTLIERPFIIKK